MLDLKLRKTKSVLVFTIIMAMVLASTACSTSGDENAPGEKSAEDVIRTAISDTLDWQRYDVAMETYIRITPDNADSVSDAVNSEIHAEGTVIKEPYASKFDYTMLIETAADTAFNMEQYIKADGKSYVVYQGSQGKWLTFQMDEEELSSLGETNPMGVLDKMKDEIESVAVKEKGTIHEKEAVCYEVTFSKELYKEVIPNNEFLGVPINPDEAECLRYEFWLEEKTQRLLQYRTDFAEIMEDVQDAVTKMYSSDEGVTFNTEMGIAIDIFGCDDEVPDIEIPQEVMESAQEIKK